MARLAAFELDDFHALSRIKAFVDGDDNDWTLLTPLGWSTDMRRSLSDELARQLARPDRSTLIETGLASGDMGDRLQALQAIREWGEQALSPEMTVALDRSLAQETDEDLRDMIRETLADMTPQ